MNKIFKKTWWIVFCLAAFAVLLTLAASATTRQVSTYSQLTSAITAASDGDTIEITANIQTTGKLNVKKNLTFTGAAGITLSSGNGVYLFDIYDNSNDLDVEITLQGPMTFKGTGSARVFNVGNGNNQQFSGSLTLNITNNAVLISENQSCIYINQKATRLGNGAPSTAVINLVSGSVTGSGYYGYAPFSAGNTTLNMTGGSITGASNAIFVDCPPQKSGDSTAEGTSYRTPGNNVINISGGTVTAGTGNALYIKNTVPNKVTATISGTANLTSSAQSTISWNAPGTLNINGGTVTNTASGTGYYTVYANASGTEITVSGGTISRTGAASVAIYMNAATTLTVSDGSVESEKIALACYAACTVTVNGGTIHATNNNVIYFSSGASTLNINGGRLYNDAASALYFAAGVTGTTVNMTGGTLEASNAAFTFYTDITINISGGHVYGGGTAVYGNGEGAALHISGGELVSGSGSSTVQLLQSNMELTVSGGSVSTAYGHNAYAVHIGADAASCAVTVTGGSFTAHGTGAPFRNLNDTSTITLSGGFSAAGGACLLYDAATPANTVAYADGTNTYVDDGFYTVAGAQVRLRPDSNGIRFISWLNADALALLTAKGATDLSFGTLLLPLDEAAKVPAITHYQLEKAGVQYADITGHYGVHYEAETGYTVKAALVRLQDKNVFRDFTAVGYMTYTIAGQTYTQYAPWSETDNVRNINAVAHAALADGGYTSDEIATLNTFVYFQTPTINGNTVNNTTYEIVIPAGRTFGNYYFTEYYTALQVQEYLKKATNYTLNIVLSNATTGKKQIRIGCDAAPAGNNAYKFAVSGNNLKITGSDYLGYYGAQEQLKAIFPLTTRTPALASSFALQGTNNSATAILSRSHNDLRIMFNNIWGGSKYDDDTAYSTPQRMDIAEAIYAAYLPDVLGLQEYHNGVRAELHSRLLALGYTEVDEESVSINPSSTYSPNTKTNAKVMATSTNSTPIYYNASTLTLLDSGYFWYADINYGSSAYATIRGAYTGDAVRGRTAGDYSKGFTWAIFRHKASNQVFLVASTHLWWKNDVGEPDDICRQIQVAYAKQYLLETADGWLETNEPSAAAGSMPIFFGGDMNTVTSRDSYGMFAAQTPTTSGSAADNVFTNLNALSQGSTTTGINTHHAYGNYDETLGIYTNPKTNHNTLDYIFTNHSAINSETYTVAEMSFVGDRYSFLFTDHSPIFADINFTVPEDITVDDFDPAGEDLDW